MGGEKYEQEYIPPQYRNVALRRENASDFNEEQRDRNRQEYVPPQYRDVVFGRVNGSEFSKQQGERYKQKYASEQIADGRNGDASAASDVDNRSTDVDDTVREVSRPQAASSSNGTTAEELAPVQEQGEQLAAMPIHATHRWRMILGVVSLSFVAVAAVLLGSRRARMDRKEEEEPQFHL